MPAPGPYPTAATSSLAHSSPLPHCCGTPALLPPPCIRPAPPPTTAMSAFQWPCPRPFGVLTPLPPTLLPPPPPPRSKGRRVARPALVASSPLLLHRHHLQGAGRGGGPRPGPPLCPLCPCHLLSQCHICILVVSVSQSECD